MSPGLTAGRGWKHDQVRRWPPRGSAASAPSHPCGPAAPRGVPGAGRSVSGRIPGVRAMRVGLLGRKVGMTQIYQENGIVLPVTVLECGPCMVLQVRTQERDGYDALQLGFDDKKRKNATQAERGHARKVDAEPKRYIREVRQDGPTEVAQGQTLTVDLFNEIKRVDVTGTSKGRGYPRVIQPP